MPRCAPSVLPMLAMLLLAAVRPAAAQTDEAQDPLSEMASWHIVCVNDRGRIVVSIPIAYGVAVDPTGTVYTYRTNWLGGEERQFVKAADVSCEVGRNS